MTLIPRSAVRTPVAFLLLLISASSFESDLIFQSTGRELEGKCSGSGQSFYCPNCGGIEVDDCLSQCVGYLNTDVSHSMCYSRKLFNNHDTSDNPDEHYHYLWNDIVGAIVFFIAAGVATACGVGGGGIYVPLGILLLQFAPKPASGLSQASIFGASLSGLIINIRSRHPNEKIRDLPCQRDEEGDIVLPPNDEEVTEEELKQELAREDGGDEPAHRAFSIHYSLQSGRKYYTRPLIDYDMALFLAPMEMAGAVLGILVQTILPNWLYLLLASVILSFTSYKTYKKFLATRKKEKDTAAKEKEKEGRRASKDEAVLNARNSHLLELGAVGLTAVVADIDPNTTTANSSDNNFEDEELPGIDKADEDFASSNSCNDSVNGVGVGEMELAKLRAKYLAEDARQYPREKIVAFLILWIGLGVITFLKGGKGVESVVGITCESPWYAVLIACQFLWTIGFAVTYAFKLRKKQKLKDDAQYPWQPHDVIWDLKKMRFYSTFTFLAGVVAGLIGIGGGMVLGPLMLLLGIHPRVSTATTATMIVLTSSSAAVMFVTSGLVPWSYAIFFFCVCLCGAYIGKTKIDAYVKRTGKASLLIFILATIILLATLGCLVIVFTRLAANNWCFEGIKKFCPSSTDDESCTGTRLMRLLDTYLD